MQAIFGQCHCGAVTATFESAKTPAELGVRTCQCAFCRAHGAVNISDPDGKATIGGVSADIRRFTFALKTADFLICKTCGVYIAAVMGAGDRLVSTLNVIGLRIAAFDGVAEQPMEYGDESTDQRIARRFTKWTPTRFADPVLQASDFGPHDR